MHAQLYAQLLLCTGGVPAKAAGGAVGVGNDGAAAVALGSLAIAILPSPRRRKRPQAAASDGRRRLWRRRRRAAGSVGGGGRSSCCALVPRPRQHQRAPAAAPLCLAQHVCAAARFLALLLRTM